MGELKWKRDGAGWRLYRDRRAVGRVVPDAKWPGMWRVQLPGGLSDMTNLTRAKDAAVGLAEGAESREKTQHKQGGFSARRRSSDLNRGEVSL